MKQVWLVQKEQEKAGEPVMGERVYRVPAPNLYTLRERFEKMAKQAERKLAAPVVIEHESEVVKVATELVDRLGETIYVTRRYVYITIQGGQVRIPGWQFLAVLQHTDAGNVIRRVPSSLWDGSLEQYRDVDITCDHCHVNRQRIDTYVVLREDNNMTMQVGSTCLKDFTGGLSPAQCARWAEYLVEAMNGLESEPSDESWSSGRAAFMVGDVLLMAAALIRTEGYQKSVNQWGKYEPGTARWTKDAITRTGRFNPQSETPPAATDEDRERVAKAREWALNNQDDAEFTQNMRVLVQGDWCEDRDAGIIAYCPEGYRRHLAKLAREAANAGSTHVGTVGEKITLDVTLTEVRAVDTDFGISYLYTFVTEDGAVVKWFASREQDMVVGDKLTLAGTVKKHDEWQGGKQTMITRCKIKVKEVA